jgi:hypothetical protein
MTLFFLLDFANHSIRSFSTVTTLRDRLNSSLIHIIRTPSTKRLALIFHAHSFAAIAASPAVSKGSIFETAL